MSHKLGLVCFSSQPRASRSTFVKEVFAEEVAKPIRALLDTDCVGQILVVVMCNRESGFAEITGTRSAPDDKSKNIFFTPTFDALMNEFPNEVRSGKVRLCIEWFVKTDDAERFIISSLTKQGIGQIVVKRHSQPFPTPDEISVLHSLMEVHGKSLEVLGQSSPRN